MSDLHVFRNTCDWYVAASLEDVAAAVRESTGDDPHEPFHQLPDDSPLTINFEDERPATQTKTCAEWAAGSGRGFLCSTEI